MQPLRKTVWKFLSPLMGSRSVDRSSRGMLYGWDFGIRGRKKKRDNLDRSTAVVVTVEGWSGLFTDLGPSELP